MKNPPVVEVIAELRWGEGNPRQPAPFTLGDDGQYVRFGVAIGPAGYQQIERIQPEGFPVAGGSVVYRYRKGGAQQNTLYQLGPGVFSANGLPPYTSWSEYKPFLLEGLQTLWPIRFPEGPQPVWLILRYVDLFTEAHLEGLGQEEFFSRALGIAYQPTQAELDFSEGEAPLKLRFYASRTHATGREFSIEVGEGVQHITGSRGLVLNTSIVSERIDDATPERVAEIFDGLQEVAHDFFFQMLDRCPTLAANIRG